MTDKLDDDDVEKKYPGPKEFAHLHVHTIFSTLDGVAEPEEYVASVASTGTVKAIAITDHGGMGGIPDAYFAAKEHNVKMIAGCEMYYNDYHLKMKEQFAKGITIGAIKQADPELRDKYVKNRHITLLAKNATGYRNLVTLLSNAWEIGKYYKPRIWMDVLAEKRDGMVMLSGCLNGPVSHELKKGNDSGAIEYITKFRNIFGDDFYIELQMPGKNIVDSIKVFAKLAFIARQMGIKTVLTNDVHYTNRNDFEIQKLMMAIDQKKTIDDPELFHVNSDEEFLKTRAELRKTFYEDYSKYGIVTITDFEAACDSTAEISTKCEGFKPDTSPKLPEIDNADEELSRCTLLGLRKKGFQDSEVYVARMKKELKMIIDKGYSSYFLITLDLINHSKELGYDIGPGRGSCGGSLVCYLIGITSIDPIYFGLSFERFISPSRGGNLLKVTME